MANLHTVTETQSIRWHDLDALRAIAMLLGIVLHAAVSFHTSMDWVVRDTQHSEAFGLLTAAIHGFRMPVFFMMSGFFTAMLWRKRGLVSLIKQRYRRIFLPLLLSMVTILPMLILAAIVASTFAEDTAFIVAASKNDIATMEMELESGEIVDVKNADDWTALHAAAEAGNTQAVLWLIEHEADVNVVDNVGRTPLAVAEENGHTSVANILERNGAVLEVDEGGIFTQLMEMELFAHLWFLWHLWWLMIGFAGIALISEKFSLPRLPSSWVLSPLKYVWLVPLTMVPLASMEFPSYGADTSTGLLPMPHVFAYYAIFFGFGALYFHYIQEAGEDTKHWALNLGLGIFIVYPISLYQIFEIEDKSLFTLALGAVYPWLITFGLMGLFRKFFAHENKWMRYVSDASYWLYLAHLPLIILLQGVMQNWTAPALFKFTLIGVSITLVLLVMYEYLVRYRWLGRFLNGKREKPARLQAQFAGD